MKNFVFVKVIKIPKRMLKFLVRVPIYTIVSTLLFFVFLWVIGFELAYRMIDWSLKDD